MSRLSRCGSETMAESPQLQMLFQWAAVTFSIHTPFKVLFFVKKYRTMERKKRSKGSVWEFCYANKIFGTFEEEMKAYGQKWVTFCTHTHTRAAK